MTLKPASCGVYGKQNATRSCRHTVPSWAPTGQKSHLSSARALQRHSEATAAILSMSWMTWNRRLWDEGQTVQERKTGCVSRSALLQSQALPTAPHAKAALNMDTAGVPQSRHIRGLWALTLAINPFTGLFRECFLLCFITFIFFFKHQLKSLPVYSPHGSQSEFPNLRSPA